MKENVSSIKSVVPDTESRFSVRYITPDNARFVRTEGGFASLDFEGILSVEASVRNQAVNDEKEHISFFYCIILRFIVITET